MQHNDRNRRTHKTGERLIEIIEALKELDGAGVTELANHLGMSKSTTHRHLSTLTQKKYAIKDGDEYHLSLRFLSMGGFVRNSDDIYRVVKPKIKQLAEETGEVANFVVEEYGQGIFVYRFGGQQSVNTGVRVGKRTYMHHTSTGKAILAQLPKHRINEIINEHGLPSRTVNTITDQTELENELQEIQTRGYAFDRGEYIESVKTVAVPLMNPDGTVLGAISVVGPLQRMKGEWFEEEVPNLLLGTANELELNMKYS